jgi:hypothetical protein
MNMHGKVDCAVGRWGSRALPTVYPRPQRQILASLIVTDNR